MSADPVPRPLRATLMALLALALVAGATGPALADDVLPPADAPVATRAEEAAEAPAEAAEGAGGAPSADEGETAPESPAEPPADVPAPEPPPALSIAPLAGTLAVGAVDNGDGTSTYTHFDGETVTYPSTVVPGEPLRVTGTGWLAKPGHPGVDEGDEGSVIGFKLMTAAGSVIRIERVPNPRTGAADYASPDVWDIAQAAGTGEWWDGAAPGSWSIDIPWPAEGLAQNPPTLATGDAVTLQLLSGTLYSNEVGSQEQRPDVSRTIPLTITVAGEQTGPEPQPIAPEVIAHPVSASVEAGERVTFAAAATGTPAPTAQWQRSTDGGATWEDLRGATGAGYTIDAVTSAHDGWRYRAVFANAAAPEGVATEAATLRIGPRENVREHCGTSYGPGSANSGIPFCFRGPEKVVFGEPIVIEGVGGYLATDGATGSVVNFFLDAEYSGDPNTVYSKVLFPNPATGATITDRRTVAIVQANADGTWRVEVPWPTVDRISPTSDGQGSYTQAELDAKFGPGTTHSFRMLTGSLLASPPDRQRGGSLYFTVVESLEDEVGVTEPLYEHQTFVSEVEGDDAVAWVQQQVSSGQSVALTGTGWLTRDEQWGSSIVVRLQGETGAYYERAGTPEDPHADHADPTVWQLVQAAENGDVDARAAMPADAAGGDFLAVELTTVDDGTTLGDVARHWVSEPLVIDNAPFVPAPGEDATCTAAPGEASYELAPGMAVPAANVGGTIRLTGKDWCNLVGGGSLIAIKIDDGAYSRLPSETAPMFDAGLREEVGPCPAGICAQNKTIWYVIEADEDGSFDVQIPVPARANSAPAFGEGSYTLRIMTRTLSADPYYGGTRPDPSRTMKSPEFTVVAEGVPLDGVKPGKPQAAPDPVHATDDLAEAARGGVTVDQRADHWVVTVPGAEEGDWLYANVFQGQTPRFPWGGEWFEADAAGRIVLPLAGVTLPAGENKLSVQDRTGGVLGWAMVSVAAPPEPPVPSGPGTVITMVSFAAPGQPKPAAAPTAPVPALAALTAANHGGVTGVESEGRLVLTIPSVGGGEWVFLHLYTADGRVIPVDWVQVGTDHTITVEVGALPDGMHKIALVDAAGRLVGWATAAGPEAKPATTGATAGGAPAAAAGPAEAVAPLDGGFDWTSTLVLGGVALLVLAGSAAGVIVLTGTPRGATGRGGGRG